MVRWGVLSLLLLGCAASLLEVQIDVTSGSFNLNVNGTLWLRGQPPSAELKLQLLRHSTASLTHPVLGPYTETRFYWNDEQGSPLETAFLVLADGRSCLFQQAFPRGLSKGGTNRTALAFPLFGEGGREAELGAVTWTGAFSQAVGPVNLNQLPGSAVTRANGGPVVVFDPKSYRSGVLSPLDNFLGTAQDVSPGSEWSWGHGISGAVTSLKAGFVHESIFTVGEGITATMQQWGGVLTRMRGGERSEDMALTHLSYWTDNGAYYYLYSATQDQCDVMTHGSMDLVLANLTQSWAELGLPVRTVQLDDWWYKGSEASSKDHMCVKELTPREDLFPAGLPSLPPQMNFLLYGPFFCQDNVYSARHPFMNSSQSLDATQDADPTPKASHGLYRELFSAHPTMSGYEVDFLEDQTGWFTEFVGTVDGAAGWLDGMANAALEQNITVQYCMAHPAAFLHALHLPAVTNGRASGDYQTPRRNLVTYGTAAPFFAALGIAPSKDNWWSTPNQPRPRAASTLPACDGGGRNVTENLLHGLVATLSTGPVGFSDALGYSNASLIMRCCDGSGQILKPSLPLAAIDRSFAIPSKVQGGGSVGWTPPGVPEGGHVWTTHYEHPSGLVWYNVIAISVHTSWSLLRSDLYPQAGVSQVLVWDWNQPESGRLVKGTELADLQSTPDADFKYVLVAPVLAGGWVLLGEAHKFCPMSVQRGWEVEASSNSLQVGLRGSAQDTAQVFAWKQGHVYTATVVFDSTGHGSVTF